MRIYRNIYFYGKNKKSNQEGGIDLAKLSITVDFANNEMVEKIKNIQKMAFDLYRESGEVLKCLEAKVEETNTNK